jgi:L-lactate dehydrogenase complex protein LldE
MSSVPRVALFVTCLVNVFRPAVARASVNLLRAAGCAVDVPASQSCCGQPGYNAGAIDAARPIARDVIRLFEPYDHIVAPSGSCIGMLRTHYPRLFADEPDWHERALRLAAKAYEITSFLSDIRQYSPSPASVGQDITYHDSCAGLREVGIRHQPRTLLSNAGVQVREMEGTEVCCGFGGTFCARMPEISVAMADEKIAHALDCGAATLVGGDLGCLLHLGARIRERGVSLQCRHVVEVLDGQLDTPAIGAEAE